MSGFPDRENQLFDILETFTAHDLEFLVIGGYAVSAYQHRFSVDADIVITAEQFDRFATLLRDEGQRFSSATPANTRLANSTRFLTT